MVAGIIGARDNRSPSVVGVAPGVNLFAVRIFDRQGNADLPEVLCAIDWVTATRQDKDKTNDIDVANMSFGDLGSDDGNCGRSNQDALHLAICRMTAAGVSAVAAADNGGIDFGGVVPASYNEMITATAMTDYDGAPGGLGRQNDCAETTPDDSFTPFSNWASAPTDKAHTIAAPGDCILTTVPLAGCGEPPPPGGCFGAGGGTSFAAPQVTGTVALCIAFKDCKRLTASEIRDQIVRDAAAYNFGHPDYGFVGDPFRPVNGRYYGFLIRAGIY